MRPATLLLSAILLLALAGCGGDAPVQKPADPHGLPTATYEEELRSALVSYMVQPRFAPQDIVQQVCGRNGTAYLDRHSERLYLVFPADGFDSTAMAASLSHHPDSVLWGKNLLSAIPQHEPKARREVVLAMPWRHFREDGFQGLNIRLSRHTYTLQPRELVDFTTHRSVYGGKVDIITAEGGNAPRHLITNHGILVARKGEPSMVRLLSQLDLQGATREQKAQRILDFVTHELSYLDADAEGSVEMLKKPHEVLFTQGSDCSGLTVLYASLLEQTDVDYRLLYCKEHIAVAVEGDYPNENRTRFNLGGKEFTLAETTLPGYQIGVTLTQPAITVTSVRYYQEPGDSAAILDFMTRQPLKTGRVVMKPRQTQ